MPEHRSLIGEQEQGQLPERVTMPLLTLITQQSLDEDYVHVARRRAERAVGDEEEPPRRPRHGLAVVVVAVFGILVSTAAVQTSRNAAVDDASRATLVSRIETRRATVSDLQNRIVRLRARNAALDTDLTELTSTEQTAVTRTRRQKAVTGFVPVTGEGVRIVVDDPPDGDPSENVRDEDLALLADGLWSAGAEAISINGQRLTAVTAIRNSGRAINVNSRPLAPPYTVLAIGDTRTLQADLLASTHGSQFLGLVDQLGFEFDMQNRDSLRLPATGLPALRSAEQGTAQDKQARDKRAGQEEGTPP